MCEKKVNRQEIWGPKLAPSQSYKTPSFTTNSQTKPKALGPATTRGKSWYISYVLKKKRETPFQNDHSLKYGARVSQRSTRDRTLTQWNAISVFTSVARASQAQNVRELPTPSITWPHSEPKTIRST